MQTAEKNTIDKEIQKFEQFLEEFVPKVEKKSTQLNKASWILETTGSSDAADLRGELDTELRLLFNESEMYQKLLTWEKDPSLQDPLLRRQLSVLIRGFKQNQIPKDLLQSLSSKEAAMSVTYANFRPEFEGKRVSDNEIREVLKNENSPSRRKKVWEASKEIGDVLAPQILEIVDLRIQAAKSLGYPDYFSMQLDLQEIDQEWLFELLEDLSQRSDKAYQNLVDEIEDEQSQRFKVSKEELGPWAWSEPFSQEDPMDASDLDALVENVDIVKASQDFYTRMGIDVKPILDRSDMYERPGKNQHAFCTHIDKKGDVRTLNNVKNSIKWLETVLHELGHAVYDVAIDMNLPWLLRDPAHTFTTEAMALIAGRQAYRYESLRSLLPNVQNEKAMKKADKSLQRRQLIFSRWVLVMTNFEKELYRNPKQDLNALWWRLVEKYQKIRPPKNRQGKNDWAAKYHVGFCPVYYYCYLLGELFASSMEETLQQKFGLKNLDSQKVGDFLEKKLFFPGNRMIWSDLVVNVVGKPLTADAWIDQFAKQ